MIKNILLLITAVFLFSACSKDESIQDSLVGEWEFENYYHKFKSENNNGTPSSNEEFETGDFEKSVEYFRSI